MKRFFLLLALFCTLTARAQDQPEPPTWLYLTWLNYLATGNTDESHALIQYMMFSEKTIRDNEEFFRQVKALQDEMTQEEVNQAVPASQ